MPILCKRQSLRLTKTLDSDKCVRFQLDKHEVEWRGTIKKDLDSLAPTPHSGETSTTNISQATLTLTVKKPSSDQEQD
jgi:hypothetical protein